MTNKPYDTHAVTPQQETRSEKILIVTANNTEDQEFFYPYYRFTEAGYHVDVATPNGGEFKGKNGAGIKDTMALSDVDASQYQLLYIPGGKAPEELKKNKDAIAITKDFFESKKPIAAICHGPQLLAAADVIKGCKITAWPEVEEEVTKAGAQYVNGPAVVDGLFITARWPGDLPLHLASTFKVLESQKATDRSASEIKTLRAAKA